MRRAHKTLAIVAFAAMVGCTLRAPAVPTPSRILFTPRLHSTEATYPLLRDLTRRFAREYPDTQVDLRHGALTTLLRRLEARELDYFTSSHLPVDEALWAAPLALDGIAIIVNRAQTVADIALPALRDVFSGRAVNWRDLGGGDLEIRPLTPPATTDVYSEFHRLVMGSLSVTGNALLMPGVDAMLREVAELDGAIGFIPLSQLDLGVKALRVDGVAPDQAAVSANAYPLRSTIYIIGREAPPAQFHNLVGWIQSEAGQRAAAENYSPLP